VQKLNSLEVGDYIKTIGGICGTIAEVCQDGSLVLATGSESCPGYIRIDRQQAIAEFKKKTDIKAEEPFAENVNENAAAKVETAEESPVENVEPAETEVEPAEAEVATENAEAEKVETENVNSQDEPTNKED
jgi:preprotein translocase subunit YajC